jgi:hypothetical protein
MSICAYHELFTANIEVILASGGHVWEQLVEEDGVTFTKVADMSKLDFVKYSTLATQIAMSTIFVLNSDKKQYGSYLTGLENDYTTLNQDNYPRTMVAVNKQLD